MLERAKKSAPSTDRNRVNILINFNLLVPPIFGIKAIHCRFVDVYPPKHVSFLVPYGRLSKMTFAIQNTFKLGHDI
jgi:hypothetical protein